MLLGQDKQIQAANKGETAQAKHLRSHFKKATNKLDDALKTVGKTTTENTNLQIELQVQKDLVVALRLKLEDKVNEPHREPKKTSKPATIPKSNNEEGPLSYIDSKCGKCNFVSKNRVLLDEHREKTHPKELKCLMCGSIAPNLESFKKHKKKHKAELDVGRTS